MHWHLRINQIKIIFESISSSQSTWIINQWIKHGAHNQYLHYFQTNHWFRFRNSRRTIESIIFYQYSFLTIQHFDEFELNSKMMMIGDFDWLKLLINYWKVFHRMPMAKENLLLLKYKQIIWFTWFSSRSIRAPAWTSEAIIHFNDSLEENICETFRFLKNEIRIFIQLNSSILTLWFWYVRHLEHFLTIPQEFRREYPSNTIKIQSFYLK